MADFLIPLLDVNEHPIGDWGIDNAFYISKIGNDFMIQQNKNNQQKRSG